MPSHDPQIDVSSLLEFLDVVAGELPRKIILVGVGGTAMTLLKVKASTRDIDFTWPATISCYSGGPSMQSPMG
jgi:hypothetical protein